MTERPRRRRPEETASQRSPQAEEPARGGSPDAAQFRRSPFAITPQPGNVGIGPSTSPLPNPKHERFAQAIAAGKSRIDAYDDAGFLGRLQAQGAQRLMDDVRITGRIAYLLAKAAERTVVTIESLVDELEEARLIARGDAQASAMVAATREKAVLLGLRVEKRDITTREGDPSGLTDDELAIIARSGGDGALETESDTGEPKPVVH